MGTGFSMLTKYSLLTFSTPTELANFTPRTITLPDEAHEAFVSITGPTTLENSTAVADSFAVITETKVLVQRKGLPFKVVYDMTLFDRLLDITTIPDASIPSLLSLVMQFKPGMLIVVITMCRFSWRSRWVESVRPSPT